MAKRKGKVADLGMKLGAIYRQIDLETTCCRQCVCCKVGCPQMNFCEAAQILERVQREWPKAERTRLVKSSMRYFFSNSMVKPCLLLGKGADGLPGCRVYKDRPLNCRLYGLWPQADYEARVKRFEQATKIPRESLPLNTQCPHVKRVDGSVELTGPVIDGLFRQLDLVDLALREFSSAEIDKRHNYRTLHDWVLLRHLGADRLSTLSTAFVGFKPEEAEDFLEKFEKMLDAPEAADADKTQGAG